MEKGNVAELSGLFGPSGQGKVLTPGELIELADEHGVSLSALVVAQAMVLEGKTYEEILEASLQAFAHNFTAVGVGLTSGKSFLLGTVGADLVRALQDRKIFLSDPLLDKAVVYTLAAEVGNHEIGLNPCAGTGDSCPYTGLLRALAESGAGREQVALEAALVLKLGSVFRAGKKTTGCNMEGLGAGAAVTAAVLTDLRGGSARQVGHAVVLALSPTLAVPCTPRVMVPGLCASHISAAVLIGAQASRLVLETRLPVSVDVDTMIALAARLHEAMAPPITEINLYYLGPFFRTRPEVERLVDSRVREGESLRQQEVRRQSREEVRALAARARPLTRTLGEVVVGGSSLAVGSPANMGRVCHELYRGEIEKIEIELTTDLFVRRAITVPGILMGAILGAPTSDLESYGRVLADPVLERLSVQVAEVREPEVQRIRIEATERGAMVDARNRGGGRLAIISAQPSRDEAVQAARRLGIEVVD